MIKSFFLIFFDGELIISLLISTFLSSIIFLIFDLVRLFILLDKNLSSLLLLSFSLIKNFWRTDVEVTRSLDTLPRGITRLRGMAVLLTGSGE